MRKSFVQIKGELWEKTGHNSAIVAGELWHNFGGVWAPADSPPAFSAMVMPDIQPYRSVIDGSLITSRSRHREHLRAHGCIEVGNERPQPPKREFTAAQGLREELIARFNR
jgi:hypothetical protein